MLGKDIQDQRRAVEDPGLVAQRLLQVPQLAGRELLVKNDDVALQIPAQFLELFHLARANQGRRVHLVHALPGLSRNLQPCRPGKLAKLTQ
jgi:hypothetical protein